MLRIEKENDVLRAVIYGEIDHHHARTLRAQIDTLIKDSMARVLILDFGSVSFMDSSGVGLIMGRCRNMQSIGGTVKVENVPPAIERMLKLSGVGKIVEIKAKEEAK